MSYNKPFSDLLAQAFGVTGSVLPKDGAAPRQYNGVTYWITPFVRLPHDPDAPRHLRFRRMTLRVMCRCPKCGREMAASRLKQHANTAACATRRADAVAAFMASGVSLVADEADQPENA